MRGSLGGEVLGGSLSYLVHDRTGLPAERGERQRQKTALSEARRGAVDSLPGERAEKNSGPHSPDSVRSADSTVRRA